MKKKGLQITDWAKKKKHKNEIQALQDTIEWFEDQIKPHDCGWMYTTIDGIKHRIKFLKKEYNGSTYEAPW